MRSYTEREYDAAAAFIRSRSQSLPSIGLVLGSGLSPLAEAVQEGLATPYAQIPHFPVSTVEGHAGQLVLGTLAGRTVCVMQGRFHFYEGYSLQEVTLPIRVMHRLGVETVILTNAAGGINPSFQAGDLMLIEDHINLPGMVGKNPLHGPNLDAFGPRFPSMTQVYDRDLRQLASAVATDFGLSLHSGVYMALSGPTFETPAEVRFLRTIGVDAVGMSTAPEATVAHHAGMSVLGLSTITNVAVDQIDLARETTHEEVLETGRTVVPRLTDLVMGILEKMAG